MNRSMLVALGVGAVLAFSQGACTRESSDLGPVQQLNQRDGGAGSYSWAYYTSIVARGDDVAVTWMNRNGKRNRNAMVRHSTDRARTWSAESILNVAPYQNTISVVPTVHLLPKQGQMLALWQSRRNETGQKFVLTRRSSDSGATWDEPIAINTETQAFLPVLAQGGDSDLAVAWTDERNVQRDIFVNRSLDGGKTWLPKDVRISQFPNSEAGAPALAMGSGGKAYLAWEERPHRQGRDGRPHLGFASSKDAGAVWTESRSLDLEEGDPPVSPLWPQMVQSQGRLTLVWAGGISGQEAKSWLWLSSSADGGGTWSQPVEIYTGPTQPFFQLLTRDDQVYLVWHGGQPGADGGIYFNASDDGGKTWRQPWKQALRLDQKSSKGALHPRLAVAAEGDNLAVTWQEGYKRVMVTVSKDKGKTWGGSGGVTVATDSEGNELRNPQVAVTGNAAYVLWERWPDKKKHIKSFADIEKVLPKDNFVRRLDIGS